MLCVFTFAVVCLLHSSVWGRQDWTNVEELDSKAISPCPVASIRFGPGGRPWRIYKYRCSTFRPKFRNVSLVGPANGPNVYEDIANFVQNPLMIEDADLYPIAKSKALIDYQGSKFDPANIFMSDFFSRDKSLSDEPNQNKKSFKKNDFTTGKNAMYEVCKNPWLNLVRLYEREDFMSVPKGLNDSSTQGNFGGFSNGFSDHKEAGTKHSQQFGIKVTTEPFSYSPNPQYYDSKKQENQVKYDSLQSFTECFSESTTANYIHIENVLSVPEIVNLKRSYGKHMKRPDEERPDDDVFKKAIENFSDFITIKYLLGSYENTTDSLEIIEHILERLSLAPEPKVTETTEPVVNQTLSTKPTASVGTTYRPAPTRHMTHTTSPTHRHTTHHSAHHHHHSTTSHKSSTKNLSALKSTKSSTRTDGATSTISLAPLKNATISMKTSTVRIRSTGRTTSIAPRFPLTTNTKFFSTPAPSSNYPAFDESGLFPYSQNQSVRDYVTYMSERAACMNYKNTMAQWNLETNMSHISHKQATSFSVGQPVAYHREENLTNVIDVNVMVTGLELIHFQRTLNRFLEPLAKENIQDPMLQREIKLLYLPGMSILPDIKIAEFEEILFAMDTIYSSATVNKWNNPQIRLHLEDVIEATRKSQSPEELKYYWVEWRAATGHKLRSLFEQYIELQNLTAISNGFSDAGEMWTRDYETEDFMQLVGCHWEEIRPLYQELHAFVRARLHKYYGEVAIKCNHSPIPTHLTGELWGQSWKQLYNITEPFPKANCNFYPDLKAKGFSKSKLISQTEHFYISLGFPPLPEGFWKRSCLNIANMEMSCASSSWDMHDGHDFRIKMCFNGTVEDYLALHHEMAYIEYFREYRNLSFPFRRGPNPAFHEGIAGALMLSVQSPAYLNKMGILKLPNSKEGDINFLLNIALDKLAYLPYSYIVDLWRFRVFTGEIKPNDYNEKWWKMRLQYQGIIPPVRRTSEDFDPGSVYHIATNKPYLQNFISTILEFQFFEALCRKSGKVNDKVPLHKCDLYNSPQVGSLLRYVMQMGASRHWRVAMKALTDSRQINSRALLEYFSPLYDWLKKENFRTGQRVGWSDHIELG